MYHGNKDRASVIDLDNETITEINFQKKTYSVMTFAEMKQAMEDAMQRVKNAPQQPQQQQGEKPDVKTDFKVDIKNTGQTKEIAGLQAKEMILTMQIEGTDQKTGNKGAMVVTSDMWLAKKISGYDEVRDFHRKMAQKMAWTPDSMGALMGRPDMARAMDNMRKEGAKMDGIPVLTVMKMSGAAEGQAQTDGSDKQAAPPQQSSEQTKAKPDLGSVLGGRFGGFGRKKKQDDSAQSSSAPASTENASASGILMETTTESSGFSNAAVDAAKFSAPAGFKKVDAEITKRQRK
jgi:hypothetical protein